MEDRGALRIFLAVIMGVALVGFLQGTRGEPPSVESSRGSASVDADAEGGAAGVPVARSYVELRASPRGTGSGWEDDLAHLAGAGPRLTDPVALAGASKAVDLATRAQRRAYDGAPPRIPHAIRQDSASECLACHEDGLRFRGLLASPVSHSIYTSCTQCHVVEQKPMPGGAELPADPRGVANTFVGLASPAAGSRAWNIAPPQIPHRTWMREQCGSCHGVNGRNALRSTHPSRASCTQCHASSADAALRTGSAP